MKGKILAALKTKYGNLGFGDKAFEGVAEMLAATITEEENIETAVAGVEALLKSFQGDIDHRVSALKTENEKLKKQQQTKGQEQGGAPAASGKGTTETRTDDMPAWAKAFGKQMETLAAGLSELKSGKTIETRKQVLETKLKDANPKFKAKALKDFGRMKFESDEDFDNFVEETITDAEDFTQAAVDQNMGAQGRPLQGTKANNAKAIDADIEAWAKKNQPAAEKN